MPNELSVPIIHKGKLVKFRNKDDKEADFEKAEEARKKEVQAKAA